jgi:small subunit ribosomal protein S1
VLPVRPITAPVDGDAGDLDNMPELGLSEDVFAGADAAPADDTSEDAASDPESASVDEPAEAGPEA